MTSAFTNLRNKPPSQSLVFAQIADSTVLSPPALYLSQNDSKVVPALNLVIQVTSGKISGFIWDTGCLGCATTDTCLSGRTLNYKDSSQSYTWTDSYCSINYCSTTDTDPCDLRIFVTWVGTDSNNKYLESAGYRLSNFENQNIAAIWASMKTLSISNVPQVNLSTEAANAINSAT